MKSGIYQIRNLVNGKLYIGSAVNLNARRDTHYSKLKNNTHHSPHLQNSYNKHSREVFKFEVLFTCPKEDLIRLEQYCINNYQPEYNICQVAGSCLGVKRSNETKQKLRDCQLGRTHTEETKRKLSNAHLGKTLSHEHAEKVRLNNKGKCFSTDHKIKISIANTGKVRSQDTRLKISRAKCKVIVKLKNNIIVEEFQSISEASQITGISFSKISKYLRGCTKQITDYCWKYKTNI